MLPGTDSAHGKLLMGLVLMVAVATAADGVPPSRTAVIQIQPAYRVIPDPVYPVDPEFEAALPVVLAADRPIDLDVPNADFVRVDEQTFTTVFPWNWSGPRTAVFRDDLGDLTTVEVTPGTPRPFEPTSHGVPVIHVVTDSTHLWDPETGIYVLGNHDNCIQIGAAWERPARFEYYEPQFGLVIDEPIGLRISGGYSRYYHQKGLRFYFDGYGASDTVEFPFFDDGPDSFRRLIVRGNRYDSFAINTNLLETLFRDLGHLASRYRFVALYLNNEYWGAYSLRERLDDEFFETTWDLESDGYNLIKDGVTEVGIGDGWWTFLESFSAVSDPEDDTWFDTVQHTMDLASYIDWQIINMFCVSGDNGYAWNLVLFQPGDHPWRFVMWDEDLSFRIGDEGTNMFRFYTARDEAEWNLYRAPADDRPWSESRQRWHTMFRTLLGNSDFRRLFHARFEHLMGGAMTSENLIARVDDLAAGQWPEIPGHADRWEGFREDWYDWNIDRTGQWITDRRPIFLAQAATFFTEWPAPAWPEPNDGLVINEFLALNDTTNSDEAGDFNDWVEIANVGTETRDLTGMFLTDDLVDPTRWEFPATMLRPGEHLIVWCDGDPAEGPLHAAFKLSGGGEEIGLYASLAAGNGLVDSHVFGVQQPDVSEGRSPDGAPDWGFFDPPTPGATNGTAISTPEIVPPAPIVRRIFPNPFNPTATIDFETSRDGHVELQVLDLRGRLVATITKGVRPAGQHRCTWNGRDASGRAVASGVYGARLVAPGGTAVSTMVLVR